jgi:hypothetical protein
MLSTEKSPHFLPVGKDFTIPARFFLRVGNVLRDSPAKETKRQDDRGGGKINLHNLRQTLVFPWCQKLREVVATMLS